MTDNWNALTGDERTKALAEGVLGWELARGVYHNEDYLMGCEKSPTGIYWYDFHDQDCIPIKVDEFAPLTDLRHTAILWAALTWQVQYEVLRVLAEPIETSKDYNQADVELAVYMLDPLKLSQAIYAVRVGKE